MFVYYTLEIIIFKDFFFLGLNFDDVAVVWTNFLLLFGLIFYFV